MATILDQFGHPIDLAKLKEEQAGPSLMGIRNHLSNHPSSGLTAQRLGRLLKRAEEGDSVSYLELAEDMEEKDLHYQGVMGTRKRQVSQLELSVIPASDDANDMKNAELVKQWLERDSLQDELFDILDAIGKGFSVQEIMWDISERQWMPNRLTYRQPSWFDFDPNDGKTIMLRGESGHLKPLTPYKFVVHFHKAKSGIPIRGGLARGVSWAYLFKNFDVKSWVSFAEVFGKPLRIGKYGPDANEKDKRTLLRAIAGIAQDAAGIIPESMAIDFVEAKLSGNTDLFERLATYLDLQVSKAVLGQTTTTDAVSGGHAVSKEHNEVREDIERSDAKQLSATLNRDVVKPYIDLNRGPQKRYPRLSIGRPEIDDIEALIKGSDAIVNLGGQVSRSFMHEKLRIPEPKDEKDVLAGKVEPQTVQTELQSTSLHAQNDGPDEIEKITEESLSDWEQVMQPVIDPIEQLFAKASSYEEVMEGLPALATQMDFTEFQNRLSKASFAARIAGEVEADIGKD